jgi:hypothetical protein
LKIIMLMNSFYNTLIKDNLSMCDFKWLLISFGGFVLIS